MAKFLVIFFAMFVLGQALTPSSYLTTVDKKRLTGLFEAALTGDENSLSYAILGLKLIGQTAPNAGDLCKKLQVSADKKEATASSLFLATSAAKALGSTCSLKLNAGANKVLTSAASSEVSVSDLHNGVLAQANLGQKANSAAVLKSLTAALKKDDSLANLGLAFKLASVLDGASAVFDRIEDAVVQADEINGKVLQFEGGLSVSSDIVTGAYALAKTAGKTPPITKMQSVKLANYFLSRKNVQQARGAWSLLSALQTLATNVYHIPVAITLSSAPSVSEVTPKVSVMVTDVLGNSLGAMNVVIDSAMRQSDGAVVMAKSTMKALDETHYEVDMMSAKPGRGFYELTLTATPSKANAKLAGNEAAVLLVKALGAVSLDDVEVGVADADQSTAAKMTKIEHPNKLAKVLEADHHHKVVIKFTVKDKASGEKIKVHQAFVRLALEKAEIIYVAETEAGGSYKFDLDISAKAKEFGGKSGKYSISLIIGDAVISNPINWNLADIKVKFPEESKSDSTAEITKSQPEIRHLFREPEQRPPRVVSSAFTILVLLPFGILFGVWMKLGVNISSFPISLSALGFHLGLGSIFGLYYYFWLQLDMFTTIKYLIMAAVVTFLCGNSMLVKIAEKRRKNNN